MGLQGANLLAREHAIGDERKLEIILLNKLNVFLHEKAANFGFRRQSQIPILRFRLRRLGRNLQESHAEDKKHMLFRIRGFPGG